MKGEHCSTHGGSTPAQKKSMAPAVAAKVLVSLGQSTPTKDPIGALERLSGDAMALVEALRGAVDRLGAYRYEHESAGEQIRGEVQAYLTALARAESINGRIVALDLYDRRLKLEEGQARELLRVINNILTAASVVVNSELQAVIEKELTSLDFDVDSTAEDED